MQLKFKLKLTINRMNKQLPIIQYMNSEWERDTGDWCGRWIEEEDNMRTDVNSLISSWANEAECMNDERRKAT